ncbi:hypothetical protein [Rhizobium sp. AG207R]|uniref:hypothetical protein n=1 Tax=Rhizobium sp. AG207R TaxID=2802287 RepID=UPI0022AC4268|nr:hypothetical protein [Rhizobium sp. AG207R]MCZ3377429.1 hypothetical protein [Rhizobium sp. AG207R]
MTEATTEIKEGTGDQTATTEQATTDTGTQQTTTEKSADASSTQQTDAADGGKANDTTAALPDNWRELASGGNEDRLKLLKRYGSLDGVVKALQEAQNTIRSGKIKRDMPDPKDEKAMAEWRKEQGIPETAEGYKLPEPVTKRLVDADKPVLSSFTEFAHAKNAPPAFVEMAAEWYVDMAEKAAEAQAQQDTAARETAEDALRDAWSRDEYKGNMQLAKRFMSGAGDIGDAWTEARLPDGRRLGDIPGFIQWASDQGRNAFGDVSFASSDAETRHNSRKAEIEKIRDTDFDRYEAEGLNKEYREILEKELKRPKR